MLMHLLLPGKDGLLGQPGGYRAYLIVVRNPILLTPEWTLPNGQFDAVRAADRRLALVTWCVEHKFRGYVEERGAGSLADHS